MKKLGYLIIAVAALVLIVREVSAGEKTVCYRWENVFKDCNPIETDSVYKLDIKRHSTLTTKAERKKFGHSKQTVYSVHGKHVGVCAFGDVWPAMGTIVIAGKNPGEARLGLVTFSTTGCPNTCRDVEISGKSTGPGFPPESWHCYGHNKFGHEFEFDLIMVNPGTDEACCLFEDEDMLGDCPQCSYPGQDIIL